MFANKKLKFSVLILGSIAIYSTAYFLATDLFKEVLLFGKIPVLAPLFLVSFILTSLLITFLSHKNSTEDFIISINKILKALLLIIFLTTISWAISRYIIKPYELKDTAYEQFFSMLQIFLLVFCVMRIYK